MNQPSEFVTKEEALQKLTHFINKPGVLDLNVFIELLTWEKKLLLWILQESKQADKLDELLADLSGELIEALRQRREAAE